MSDVNLRVRIKEMLIKNLMLQTTPDQIGAAKIHETGEETHIQLQHSDPLTQLARQFGHALDRKAWLGRGVL